MERLRRPPQLDYGRVDIAQATTDRGGFRTGDWLFLGWLALLGLSGFVLEGARAVGMRGVLRAHPRTYRAGSAPAHAETRALAEPPGWPARPRCGSDRCA